MLLSVQFDIFLLSSGTQQRRWFSSLRLKSFGFFWNVGGWCVVLTNTKQSRSPKGGPFPKIPDSTFLRLAKVPKYVRVQGSKTVCFCSFL